MSSNFHSQEYIQKNLNTHWQEINLLYPEDQLLGIFLQGSQNYNLDTILSDIDSKAIIIPTFKDIVLNKQAISTTHVRKNEEHIDLKDVRLIFNIFRKQNINWIEILFTKYFIVNSQYKELWEELTKRREDIARYNPAAAVKTMRGMAMEKYKALKHPYPSKIKVLEKYGYDPKQLHHIVRLEEFMYRYINGESYSNCLISEDCQGLVKYKIGHYTEEQADIIAKEKMDNIEKLYEESAKCNWTINQEIEDLLNEVLYKIIKKAFNNELMMEKK